MIIILLTISALSVLSALMLPKTPEEQAMDDRDQAEYLDEWCRTHR